MPVSYSEEGNKETEAQGECAVGVFGSCGLKQCCQKPFWYRIFSALCLSLQARIPGMDHWPVSQLSPGWQAPRSAPMHLVWINPGIKCGKYELGLSCGPAVTAGSSVCVCVCVSSKPARGCFYGSTGQQEETKPLGVPMPPSFLAGLVGTC